MRSSCDDRRTSGNETRMLAWHIHEDHDQTAAVMSGIMAHLGNDIDT
jgi:hypothetical protein